MTIRIENLSKTYGNRCVLNNISTTFEAGKIYGIVGENGAGKTTLFRCLAGLETYEGRIETDVPDFKNQLGYLQTESFFFSKMTGKEYIQLLCNARKVNAGDIENRNIFDLPLHQYADTYSTGMKKKLALTAILMQKNDFFILDEPFNGVDIQSNILITEIIHRLRAARKTILIASHIFSTLHDTCDSIQLLRGGIFEKTVTQAGFKDLESEMRAVTMGDKLERLNI
jgi:ABC-2 type transport system ATP-binding protein